MDRRSEKYFLTYATTHTIRMAGTIKGTWEVACAIPLRAEPDAERLHLSLLTAAFRLGKKALVIYVINQRASDGHTITNANLKTINQFISLGARPIAADLWLLEQGPMTTIIVDRMRSGSFLPEDEGVGLARRIGNDLAAFLWKTDRIKQAFFGNTDGDAAVPPDYFERLANLTGRGAKLFPFRHVPGDDPAVDLETSIYEAYLHYYANGLDKAGSPYGYISLGSVICLHADDYIAVRGHPKRLAGEDFYILNKIRKIAPVTTLTGNPIHLTSRLSDRVPFGTGQAVSDMRAEPDEPYRVYDPRCFDLLQALLHRSTSALRAEDPVLQLPAAVQRVADATGFSHMWEKVLRAPVRQRLGRFHDAFDGLRTLQFIHAATELMYPSVIWHQAIDPQVVDQIIRLYNLKITRSGSHAATPISENQ